MNFSRIFFTCLVFLFISSCDTQEQTAAVKKHTEIKSTPIDTPAIKKPGKVKDLPKQEKPALNLSIDNRPVEHQKNNDDIFINDNVRTEKNSALFDTLSRKHSESGVNVSGEFLTDKNDDNNDNTDFLKSIDGIQIEVKGSFN